MLPQSVLFVCTGNTCRSPMALGIFKDMLQKENITSVRCDSAGISAWGGEAASENAVEVLSSAGIDISGHRSKSVTYDMLNDTELIVCLSHSHYDFLKQIVSENKLCVLGDGISDPFGGSIAVYEKTMNEIREALKTLLSELKKDEN